MTAPLVLCACGQPAAWFDHNTRLNLCDDCNDWGNEPLAQSLRLPLSPRVVDRARKRRDALEGDNWTEARWLATLEAAEKERDALRAAVRAERLAAAEYAVAIDGGTDQEVARAWKRDTDAKQALLALLPPEAP